MDTMTKRFLALGCIAAGMLAVFPARAESCLWEATSSRGGFYLLGSVHLLRPTDYPLDRAINQAYSVSKRVVFETDIARMLSDESQEMLSKAAQLPEGKTLEGELQPEVYTALLKALEKTGVPKEAVQQYKPWYVTTLLSMVQLQKLGLDPKLGLDQFFHRKAVDDGKKTLGLESIEFQIGLFDGLSNTNQNAYAAHALKELDLTEAMLEEMQKAWKAGDLDKLACMVAASFEGYPEMYESFVLSRNRTWADKLDALADPGIPTLVVVGAAHLGGEKGLLSLLKEKGYKVRQL